MAELTSLEQFTNLVSDGEREHDVRKRRYDRAYEIYRSSEPKGVRKLPWESQLRIPYGRQQIDTELVNLVGGAPRANVRPRRPQDHDTAPLMKVVLDYHAAEDHLVEKMPVIIQQGLVYGPTVVKNTWLYREQVRPVRQFTPNPYDPDVPLDYERTDRVVLRDGPTLEPWDVYECFWEPNARDVDSALYIVLGSWMTKQELLENAISERNPYGLFEMDAVEELLKDGTSAQRELTAQERARGGNANRWKDRFYLREIWRETPEGVYQTILGEKRTVLQNRPSPFAHGHKPVAIGQMRPDMFELEGASDTELIDHIQQALQSIENASMDNLNMTVHRGFTYRETGITDIRSLTLKPRFMWPVQDHDDIRPVDMPVLGPDTFRMKEELLGRLQFVTGVTPYISGADSAGVDQNTATGVTALQGAASAILRFKARQVATKVLQRSFEQWGELVQQFMDKRMSIRIEGAEGYDWASVDPQEIAGNYDYSIEGVEESVSRQQEKGDAIGLLNALAPFAQMPGLNFKPIIERVAKAFDISPEAIWQQPQAPQPAAPNGGSPPAGDPRLQQNGQGTLVGGQQLPPGPFNAIQQGG